MATTAYSIDNSDGWTEIAADAVDFILENRDGGRDLEYTFKGSAPGANDPYHTLKPGEVAVRAGVSGACYIRNRSSKTVLAVVS